jgi:hypothetical protein
MKLKKLKKKIRQLEKRLQQGPGKLARLKEELARGETVKALKAARKSAGRVTAAQPAAERKKRVTAKKAKRKLNLSPERLAQLAAAMKARWAAKRAAEASTITSTGQNSAQQSTAQPPETRPDGA